MNIDLKKLRLLLEELDASSYSSPIIVEGRKDAESLRKIGVTGLIHSINGKSISEVVDGLKVYREVIILTDYDNEGLKIKDKLVKGFQIAGVKANLRYHRLLKNVLKGFIIQIEGLFKFLRSKGYCDEDI